MPSTSLIRLAILCVTTCSVFCADCQAAERELNGHRFTLPEGFEIELVAGPPLINRPITAAFDERGRLYVADSSGSNDKIEQQLAEKPHRIVRLEDSNDDGTFDASVVFADKMMFPEGTMWLDGSLYVAAPPSIWKLTDTDQDGVADQRHEWFQGKTLTGCANDLHGPYLGPDGWIYWCKGAFAEQTHSVHGKPWTTKASHIFRCRADGSGIEPVMTGGMDNPVDTVFMPNGDRIFTTTFLVHPGNGQRDGLIHAVYGGVYGKDHGVLEGHRRTGELMPVLSHLGAAAPCGLVRYESTAFGADYRNNLFTCQFNLHKLSRHVLEPRGASYMSRDEDFLVSDNIDFHPTDVVEDADGSLLIVDTGGWYKLCCPTSQLHKPDILGGIYRVRRSAVDRAPDPRGIKLDWEATTSAQLVSWLMDDRPAVRHQAAAQLSRRANDEDVSVAIERFRDLTSPKRDPSAALGDKAKHLLTALLRIDRPEVRSLMRHIAESSSDESLRQLAMHAISLWRDQKASHALHAALQSQSAMTRRAAAECLGRIGDKSAVDKLLRAASQQSESAFDRALDHSIIYALIEIGDKQQLAAALKHDNIMVRRTAMIACDQVEPASLPAGDVIQMLSDSHAILRETAQWIVSHHPEWGSNLAGYVLERLAAIKELPTNALAESGKPAHHDLLGLLVRFANESSIQETLAKVILDAKKPTAGRALALRAMSEAPVKELPAVWSAAICELIDNELVTLETEKPQAIDPARLESAVIVIRRLPQPKMPDPRVAASLIKVARNNRVPLKVRLDAMAAIPGGMPEVSQEQFESLIASLLPDRAVEERSSAAEALSRATLSLAQLNRLAETVQSVGPLEIDRLLGAFERSTDEQLGLKLVTALKHSLALNSLRIDSVRQKLAKYGPVIDQAITELELVLNADVLAQKQRLEDLLPEMAKGDIRRGQALFHSSKAACNACHRVGYVGGTTGPDLTRIGGIRTDRDLLESILYPSLSFVRSFEPVVLVMTDGRLVNGLIRDQTQNELVLTTGPNQEVRVVRADIEEILPSTVSVMPAGLDKLLTTQELADLVAFLKNAK